MLSQSTVFFGALLIAFIIFVNARGEVPKYLDVMGL
jgi:hypothetical protein